MRPQTHDVAAQARDTRSPSNRQARSSTPSSETFIDLASPVKATRSPSQVPAAGKSRPRPPRTARISEDELRLVGDFSRPADAIACPDPQSWNMPAQAAAKPTFNKTKPGAGASFKPTDTLTEERAGSNRARHVTTYGKRDRVQQTIGRSQHGGQQAYLAAKNLATPARARGLRDATGPSPSKRPKTEHHSGLDDDAPQYITPPGNLHTPARTARVRRPSASLSQSQISVGSGRSVTTARPASQPRSEFLVVDQRLSHHRPRRRPTSARGQGMSESTPQTACIISDDEEVPARQQLLNDFQQGAEGLSRVQPVVTSDYFPNARINESTSEAPDRLDSTRKASGRTNQRGTYRQPHLATEEVDDSPDELAMSPMLARSTDSQAAPFRAAQRTGASTEIVWQLTFARSLDIELRGSGLQLKHNADKEYVIQTVDLKSNNYTDVAELSFSRVVHIFTDDSHRIRFSGSRSSDGSTYIVDLEFAGKEELSDFQNDYVRPHSGVKRFFLKTKADMRTMFATALPKRVKTSNGTHDDTKQGPSTSTATLSQQSSSQASLLQQLKAQASKQDNTSSQSQQNSTSSQSNNTTAGRTRSNGASADVSNESDEQHPVEKFSIMHGLGRAWKKPLVYANGKQRVVVNFEDLPRLDEEEYLNDTLIDFYMIYLFKQLKVPTEKVYFFNTFFYTNLTSDTGRKPINYEKVAKWTQKIDIFSYDYIVVPINESAHWYLAIICNVSSIDRKPVIEDFGDDRKPAAEGQSNAPQLGGEAAEDDSLLEESKHLDLVDPHGLGSQTEGQSIVETSLSAQKSKKPKNRQLLPKRDPDLPVIIILDSLGTTQSRYSAVKTLKAYMLAEGQAKRGMEATIKENGYYAKASQIPKQNNFTDCGVYLLGYVEKFFQDPDDFKNQLLTGEMTAAADWPHFDPRQMRTQMRNIIFECAKNQHAAKREGETAKPGKKDNQPRAGTGRAKPAGAVNPHTAICLDRKLDPAFEFKPKSSQQNDQVLNAKAPDNTDSTAMTSNSPSESATATPPKGLRRRSPEVRIPSKSPEKPRPAQAKASASPPSALQNRRQHQPGSSPQKKTEAERNAISPEQTSDSPPRKWDTSLAARSSPLTRSDREGSAREIPIEIQESQDSAPEPIVLPRRTPSKSPSTRQTAVKSSPNRALLRAAPSVEEIGGCLFQIGSPKKRQRSTPVRNEGTAMEGKVGHSRAGTPMLMDDPLRWEEEIPFEPMDIDSQDVDDMDLDRRSRSSVVQETPDPEELDDGQFSNAGRDETPILMLT